MIRRAEKEDLPAINGLIFAAYEKYIERIGKKPAPMTADNTLSVEVGELWVLEFENLIVGVILIQPTPSYLYIGNVAVCPGFQGRGFGRQLLLFAEGEARRLGILEMRLFTNEKMHENLKMYRKFGWVDYKVAEHEGFYRIFMSKSLSPEE